MQHNWIHVWKLQFANGKANIRSQPRKSQSTGGASEQLHAECCLWPTCHNMPATSVAESTCALDVSTAAAASALCDGLCLHECERMCATWKILQEISATANELREKGELKWQCTNVNCALYNESLLPICNAALTAHTDEDESCTRTATQQHIHTYVYLDKLAQQLFLPMEHEKLQIK